MTSETLCAACGFCPAVGDGERTVTGVFTGDLLSWAMGRAKEGDIWFTVMGNVNTVAVAALADCACVVLCHVVHPWLWAHILGLGSAVIVPLASFISGIYLTDTVLSVRSAIQLSAQMGKLRELQSEIRDHIAEKREESAERRAERREEARERARALRDGADIFERRLLHSHPQLKAAREDLLAGIRARLSENGTELEQLRSVYSPRRDKK